MMKTFPLESMTLAEAQKKQFDLVDIICRHFSGADFLRGGDLGLIPELNQPGVTQCVENVIARMFSSESAVLVQGAGTGAIRVGLAVLLKPGGRLLVHNAPVYPTTAMIAEQTGLSLIRADYNDTVKLRLAIRQLKPDAALVQHTRQSPEDSYSLTNVLGELSDAGIPTLTDDNYAVMKVRCIGCECGATLSAFSCFKLFGPEGGGVVVGDRAAVTRIRATMYSGGCQVQGTQALDVLRGMVCVPVMQAVQTEVTERLLLMLNSGVIPHVKQAIIASAQSKVLLVEFYQPIAQKVLEHSCRLGALPYPVGAESRYEIPPLFYRLSGTFREAYPDTANFMIRINPNRSGEQTILRILEERCRMSMTE